MATAIGRSRGCEASPARLTNLPPYSFSETRGRWFTARGARGVPPSPADGCKASRPPSPAPRGLRTPWPQPLAAAEGVRRVQHGSPIFHPTASQRREAAGSPRAGRAASHPHLRMAVRPAARPLRPQGAFEPHGRFRNTGLLSRAAAPPLQLAALRWRVASVVLVRSRPPPGSASSGFSVSRVWEPGTAGRESAGLRPEGGRRMPGTHPSGPWRLTEPLRSPVREFSCSAGPENPVRREARERSRRQEGRLGAHGTRSQSFRRLRVGRRCVASSSAMTGFATRVSENPNRRQRHSHVSRTQAAPPLVAWASSPRRVDHLRGGGRTVGRMPTAPWGVMVVGHHSAPCGAMVAWASSPRKEHSPSEQRPHDGQDARRLEFGH
jgi:hypothetical protein